MRSSRGFTLLEIMIVLAIIAVLAAVLIPAIGARLESARLDASVAQAQKVLKIAEIARRKITSSTTAPSGQVTHTYNNLANWQPVSSIESMLQQNYKLPSTNTFGLPILVRFDEKRSYVAVDLPFLESEYTWHPTEVVGGRTRIIVSTEPFKPTSGIWVSHQKRVMHNEVSR